MDSENHNNAVVDVDEHIIVQNVDSRKYKKPLSILLFISFILTTSVLCWLNASSNSVITEDVKPVMRRRLRLGGELINRNVNINVPLLEKDYLHVDTRRLSSVSDWKTKQEKQRALYREQVKKHTDELREKKKKEQALLAAQATSIPTVEPTMAPFRKFA